MPAGDIPQWGIVGSLVMALLAVGRTLWRWERTFSDAARDEIGLLRTEVGEMRAHIARCEAETAHLRAENVTLRDEVEQLKRRFD